MTTTEEGISRAATAFKSIMDLMCSGCGWRECRCEEFAAHRDGRFEDELAAILRSFTKRTASQIPQDEVRARVKRWAERHGRPVPPVHFCRAKRSVFVGPKEHAGDALCGLCGDCQIEDQCPPTR